MVQAEQIYNTLTDALPADASTDEVVKALGALLSAVIIVHAKDQECRIIAAKNICERLMLACQTVSPPSEKPRYLN